MVLSCGDHSWTLGGSARYGGISQSAHLYFDEHTRQSLTIWISTQIRKMHYEFHGRDHDIVYGL